MASVDESEAESDAWLPHVSVESIDRTAEEGVKLGATVLGTADIPGLARLATIRDPEGAIFGLWQPGPHQGAQVTDETGSLWWIEVLSKDVAGALAFYERLFGWESVEISFAPFNSYFVFKRVGAQEGGILPIGDEWDTRLSGIRSSPSPTAMLQSPRKYTRRLHRLRPHRSEARTYRLIL